MKRSKESSPFIFWEGIAYFFKKIEKFIKRKVCNLFCSLDKESFRWKRSRHIYVHGCTLNQYRNKCKLKCWYADGSLCWDDFGLCRKPVVWCIYCHMLDLALITCYTVSFILFFLKSCLSDLVSDHLKPSPSKGFQEKLSYPPTPKSTVNFTALSCCVFIKLLLL